MDSFSYPKIRFKISTQKGVNVEIKDAKPLVMYFSEYVVNPFARTIINIDNTKARKNWVGLTFSSFFWDNK